MQRLMELKAINSAHSLVRYFASNVIKQTMDKYKVETKKRL